MKKLTVVAITFALTLAYNLNVFAQSDNTSVYFLKLTSDARAAGLGDIGIATSPDAFSQHWNPSKYAFATNSKGVALSYTPYLGELVDDVFLGNLNYFSKINDRSAWAASFKYFSLGEIELADESGISEGITKPVEFTLDVSYSLKLSDNISSGVAIRYIYSGLQANPTENRQTASSIAVDLSAYYQSDQITHNKFDGRWRAGINISNLGPKFDYGGEDNTEEFLPSNLRIGGGYDFILDPYNTIGINLEFNKLLVPTPPLRDQNTGEIIDGQDDNVDWLTGVFQSFGDSPGGFSEELKEITWALGGEYNYNDMFAFRAGYFNESKNNGGFQKQFFSMGAGFKYEKINLDISYLFNASSVQNPLENTLRFSLTFNIGENLFTP